MPDYQSNDGGNRRRNRGGRNQRGGRSSSGPSSSAPAKAAAKPTGLQRFLSTISFGLLGKPAAKPSSSRPLRREPSSAARPERSSSESRPPRDREREPRRSADPADVTTDRLYIGNLSYDATESDLFELFNGVGKVQNAEVVVNSRTQRSKGFAFITMASIDEAKRAVAELHGKEFMGRALQLSGAKPPPARGDRDDRSENGSEAEAAVA